MKTQRVWVFVVVSSFVALLSGSLSFAQTAKKAKNVTPAPLPNASSAGPCTNPKLPRYRVSPNSSGETIEGPACVEAVPVNTLRNFIFITTSITQTAGPSPASIFSPSTDKNLAGAAGTETLKSLSAKVNRVETDLTNRMDNNRAATAKMDDLLARLREFVAHSDESVGSGQFEALVRQIKARKEDIDQLISGSSAWKATDDILKEIHAAQRDWANFNLEDEAEHKTKDSAGKAKDTGDYNALKTRLDSLETKALQQISGSDQAKAVGKNQGLLSYWSDVLGGFLEADGSIPPDPASKFTVHQDVPCRTLFNTNKSTAVKLTIGDRLPFFDGQQMSTQTHDAFVTVNCASPFSLSGGVAFSTIEQREFAIVQSPTSPGATTTVNKFGYSSKSAIHPLPLAMAHMRFYESDSHRYAWHATFGVAANVQGTNAGGSNAEYLPGLSFSLFRTMYLTAGVHIGKQASLAGGLKVGDLVPSGIAAPPVQTSYKVGAGFAITFSKP